jgi:GDP-fucose transporter C1
MGERNRTRGLDSMFNEYPVIVLNPTASTKVLPLSLIFVGMIAFNNICLQYVAVSFYNVARSLSIVFNVIFTYLILGILFTLLLLLTTLLLLLFINNIQVDLQIL